MFAVFAVFLVAESFYRHCLLALQGLLSSKIIR